MPNYNGNPKISEYGKGTRFGAGRNCPYEAQQKAMPPWSIRRAVKILASMTVLEFKDHLANIANLSSAEAVALTKLHRAMQGDTRAMQQVTDDIDGKLRARVVGASKHSLADLITSSVRQ